jgi:hypothetical protein
MPETKIKKKEIYTAVNKMVDFLHMGNDKRRVGNARYNVK